MFVCALATVALGVLPTEEQFRQQLEQFKSTLAVESEAAADGARHASSLAEVQPVNPEFENDPLVKKIESETQQEEIDRLPENVNKEIASVATESRASKVVGPKKHVKQESYEDLEKKFRILSRRLGADIKGNPLPGAPLFPDNEDDDRDEQESDPSSFVQTADVSEETVDKPPSDLHKVAAQLRADGALYLKTLSEHIKKKYPAPENNTALQKMDFLPKKSIKTKMTGPTQEPDLNATLARLREPWEKAAAFVPPPVPPLPRNASWLQREQHDSLVREGQEHAEEMTAERDLGVAWQSLPHLQNGSSLVESKKPGEPLVDRLADADQQIRLNLLKLAKPLRLGGLLEKVLSRHSKADDRYDAVDTELKAAEDKAKWQLAKLKKDLGVNDAAPSSFIERSSSEVPSSFMERSSSESLTDEATFQSPLIYVPKHLKTRYGEIGEKLKHVMEKSHAQLERMQKLRMNLLQETSSMLEETDTDDTARAAPSSFVEEGNPVHKGDHFQKKLKNLEEKAQAEITKLKKQRESEEAIEEADRAESAAEEAETSAVEKKKKVQEAVKKANRSNLPEGGQKAALRSLHNAATEARAAEGAAAVAVHRRNSKVAAAKKSKESADQASAASQHLKKYISHMTSNAEDSDEDADPSSFLEDPKTLGSKPADPEVSGPKVSHQISTAFQDLKDVSAHLNDMVIQRKKEAAAFEAEAQKYLIPHPVLNAKADAAAATDGTANVAASSADESDAPPSSFLEEQPTATSVQLLSSADEAEEEQMEKRAQAAEEALINTVNAAHRRMDKLDALVAARTNGGKSMSPNLWDTKADTPVVPVQRGPSAADEAAAAKLLGMSPPQSLLQTGEREQLEREHREQRIAYREPQNQGGSFLETPISFADRMAEIENSIKTGTGVAAAHMDALAEKLAPNPYAEAMGVRGAAQDHLDALRHDLSDHLRKH